MIVNNLEFNVRVRGSGVPFVWGHGLMGSIALENRTALFDWERIAELATVVRYDARGHGLSEPTFTPDDYHWANLAGDMLAIADHLGFDTFVAGGQSMGCATALYAAIAARERVKGLVLVNPPTAWETRAAQASLYEQMAGLVEKNGVAVLVRLMRQVPVQPAWRLESQPDLHDIFVHGLESFDPKVLVEILRGAKGCNLPEREALKSLHMPALILAWLDDPTHPVETAEEFGRLLPHSQMVAAHSAGEAATWGCRVREFLGKLS